MIKNFNPLANTSILSGGAIDNTIGSGSFFQFDQHQTISANAECIIKSAKFYEIMPYFTVLEHFTYFSPLMASPHLMKKLDADQTKALLRAAKEASDYQKEVMGAATSEIRKFLTTEGQGGMKTVEFERADFIAAGQRVQDRYATEKGAEFTAFVQAIRAAAN